MGGPRGDVPRRARRPRSRLLAVGGSEAGLECDGYARAPISPLTFFSKQPMRGDDGRGGEEAETQRGRAAMLSVALASGAPFKSRLERLSALKNSKSSQPRLLLSTHELIAAFGGCMPARCALRDTPKMAAGGGRARRRVAVTSSRARRRSGRWRQKGKFGRRGAKAEGGRDGGAGDPTGEERRRGVFRGEEAARRAGPRSPWARRVCEASVLGERGVASRSCPRSRAAWPGPSTGTTTSCWR